MDRAWDGLPNIALVNIFCRTSIKDRTRSVPLVCPLWALASRDPRCWTSMVPDSAVEYAFIKDSKPYADLSVDAFHGRAATNHRLGVSRLETLIQRSDGGGGITSLYLFPFLASSSGNPNDDALLRLIAHRCPNLKYFSLHGSNCASEEAILDLIHSCTKLELVDFANSPYFSPLVLEEMGKCCPNLRGIRRNGSIEPSAMSALATSFPGLRLLNLSDTPILEEDLLTIVSTCPGLQYLDVRRCRKFMCGVSVIPASVQIAEFFYDRDLGYLNDYAQRYIHLDEYTDRVYCDSHCPGYVCFDDGDDDGDGVTDDEVSTSDADDEDALTNEEDDAEDAVTNDDDEDEDEDEDDEGHDGGDDDDEEEEDSDDDDDGCEESCDNDDDYCDDGYDSFDDFAVDDYSFDDENDGDYY